ncbi:MAG: class I SAM-dependent methyltransferase [Chloroflexota bacterium]
MGWNTYYDQTAGRKPRQLLVKALDEYIPADFVETRHQAADIGCGSGIETAFLIDRGWDVLAIDKEAIAIRRLKASIKIQEHLQTQIAPFEAMTLPDKIDLAYAGYSLPFCHPDHFVTMWRNITTSIAKGGYFVGEFFGERDSWATNPEMTFNTAVETRLLFTEFEILFFHERDSRGQAVSGDKHWHVFSVIARKLGNQTE